MYIGAKVYSSSEFFEFISCPKFLGRIDVMYLYRLKFVLKGNSRYGVQETFGLPLNEFDNCYTFYCLRWTCKMGKKMVRDCKDVL